MSLPQPEAALRALLGDASIEVTAREPSVVDALCREFASPMDVHVTFLPDDAPAAVQDLCVRLRRAGHNPIPHLTARNFVAARDLEEHLSRLAQAAVNQVLVIAGDVDKPRGVFPSSIDLLRTGLLQRYGITRVRLAGHPEGHPAVDDPELDRALAEKIAYACGEGLGVEIVTQFCFEAEPVLDWIARNRARGIDAPVRVGVAGPAGTATLLKFAIRCGVGNSLRALRKRSAVIGKLMSDTTPDDVLQDVAAGMAEAGAVSGIHLYMFGGMKKTAAWLKEARRRAEAAYPVSQSIGSISV